MIYDGSLSKFDFNGVRKYKKVVTSGSRKSDEIR
jgi:hypothetical protein